jgi:hypothetical protein
MIEDFKKNILVDVVKDCEHGMVPGALRARLILFRADNYVVLVANTLLPPLSRELKKVEVIHLPCTNHQCCSLASAAIGEEGPTAE